MTAEPRKPTAAFWLMLALLALLAYPLSVGPACWISSRAGRGEQLVTATFRPLMRLCEASKSSALDRMVAWYSEIGAADGWHWFKRTPSQASRGVGAGDS